MASCAPLLALVAALVALSTAHAQQAAPVVSFLAPQDRVSALETLGPNSAAAHPVGRTPLERGVPSWGAYLTAPDAENAALPGPTTVRHLCSSLLRVHVGIVHARGTAEAESIDACMRQGTAVLYLNGPGTLAYNITLNRAFDPADQLQSILLSVPQFINTSALTLGFLYGPNATTCACVVGAPSSSSKLPAHGSHVKGTLP